MNLSRRSFLGGILAACAAPAIIRTPGLIMPVKPVRLVQPIGDMTNTWGSHLNTVFNQMEQRTATIWARRLVDNVREEFILQPGNSRAVIPAGYMIEDVYITTFKVTAPATISIGAIS